jgi:serine/threonine-protein kinase
MFASSSQALRFVRHLAAALKLLWDRRIVHRDVKPDNILVKADNTPVVIDLGIARLLDSESLTVSHAARGPCTPVYAAPEQLRNRKAMIDPRTDQFALGIVLVQLLLKGAHPFDPNLVGAGDSVVHNILAGRWYCPAPPLVSPATQSITRRLLGSEPHERFRSSQMLLSELDRLLEAQ